MRLILFSMLLSAGSICFSQTITIVDPCFSTPVSATTFSSSSDITNANDADLLQWTGSTWTGQFSAANLTLAPPTNSTGCRAVFLGGTNWTTGGEGFGVRLSGGMVAGQTYTFPVTYVSHGLASTGSFSPTVHTNANGLIGGFFVGNLPPAGFSWTTNILSITATAAQAGHNWIMFHSTGGNGVGSGMISSFCPNCSGFNPCQVSLGSNTTICTGQTLVLNATTQGATYLWQNNSTGSTFTVTTPGTYYVQVNVGNCMSSDTIQVADGTPVPSVSVNSPLCAGQLMQLSASGGATYSWAGPNAFTSNLATVVINPAAIANSGNYFVTLFSAIGCTATAQLTVVVHPQPTIAVNSGSVCSGQVFTIAPSGASSYTIQGGISQVTPVVSTSYTVAGTSSAGCVAVNQATSNVVVNPSPTMNITASKTLACAGDVIKLTASGASQYQWAQGGNSATTAVTTITNASYSVTGTSTLGCISGTIITVNVKTCTSLSEIGGSELPLIYPNPAAGTFVISASHRFHVTMYNQLAQKILDFNLSEQITDVPVNHLPAGIYTLSFSEGSMVRLVRKLVVE
jgi:hypothetical protein